METKTTPDYTVTTFNNVVVEKSNLLTQLKLNRDKHNMIYEASVSGYWVKASEVLQEKQKHFDNAVNKIEKEFDNEVSDVAAAIQAKKHEDIDNLYVAFEYNAAWPLVYPVNHLEDYERVINMLEFSVADKVSLSSNDFDAYVRNNWNWKKDFITSNSAYLNAVSGCLGPVGLVGSQATYVHGVALKGVSAF